MVKEYKSFEQDKPDELIQTDDKFQWITAINYVEDEDHSRKLLAARQRTSTYNLSNVFSQMLYFHLQLVGRLDIAAQSYFQLI